MNDPVAANNQIPSVGRMTPTQLIELLQPLDEQFEQIETIEHGIQTAHEVMKKNETEYDIGMACLLLAGLIGAGALLYACVSEPWNHDAPVASLIAGLIGIIPLLVGLNQLRVYRHNIDTVFPALYPAIAADEQSIDTIRKTMRPTLLLLPVTCRNGEANAYILQMLICGRADGFNTAVTLWEEHEHRRRMEQYEQDKVTEARKQTTALAISAPAQASQAFEARRQTRELRGLRDDLNNRH
ncbi:hypothetical protein [Bifidobacterium samirii]|uniref:Uncharacterized protein n=1 Tax=Bifidobacterium samirii TaxID=2306974 RepID=A0A430FJG0_9BIFI|nr:hypothetical protein [Bifidobacterium samirii]RSX52966.1 hypothetical protein D2E24_1737 [Bifidobacterium samirii]